MRSAASRISLAVVLLMLTAALAAPWLGRLGLMAPEAMDAQPYLPPGLDHWFGTDNFGRDVFARVVWGSRVALVVAVGSSALASLLGICLGALAGYFGGWIDGFLSRTFDVFLLIPTFFLVLLIVALFGASLPLTLLAIAITTWPRSARIMRAQVLTLRGRVYVQAARAAGASHLQALTQHVIPNGLGPIVTDGTLLMGLAVLTEASLSFLGLGDPDTVSWGLMIFDGQRQLRLAPWMSIFPGLAMLLLVAAFNLLGDGLGTSRLRRMRPRTTSAVPAAEPGLLAIEDLCVDYQTEAGLLHAVNGVSLRLERGDRIGIVGESGCGKSTLAAALMQILPANAAATQGRIRFDGNWLLHDGAIVTQGRSPAIDRLRWVRIAMIFQSAMNALNPVMTVRRQLIEAYRLHRPQSTRQDATARVETLFGLIGVPRDRLDAYPHELSGGMRQRVVIALSLLFEPDLVVADEPTTALDALIKDQILGEILALQRRMNLALILISHDMGAVAETCARIAVMYGGEIVETGPTEAVFAHPAHPYTRMLIDALPRLHGPVLAPRAAPAGGMGLACKFAPRCPGATEICRTQAPVSRNIGDRHEASCHHPLAEGGMS